MCVDRLALCLVLWFMLGCYPFHFFMGFMFDLTHPHLNPLFQTCNMAWMGSFYPFPLCSVCCFPMFSMPYHGEYHSSPLCRRFYTREHPQSWPQVQLVLAQAGAGWCWLASSLPPRGGGDRAEARRGGRGKLEEKGSLGLGLELGH